MISAFNSAFLAVLVLQRDDCFALEKLIIDWKLFWSGNKISPEALRVFNIPTLHVTCF